MALIPDWRRARTADLPDLAIAAKAVTKTYRGEDGATAVTALAGADLFVPRGSVFGLLGPNGAGKSTLINILAGLVRRSAGEIAVWGYDIDRDARRSRASIGVVPQELNMDPFFTVEEMLDVQAGYYGVPRAKRRTGELLEIMGLAGKARARGRALSGGQQRRLMVARAMVHDPPVLVLDEPTAGVDIELRQQIYRYVEELRAGGTTILLTTHYLEEADRLCDRVAIIHEGKIVACDTKAALLAKWDHKELTVRTGAALTDVPRRLAALGAKMTAPDCLVFHYGRKEHKIGDLLDAVRAEGIDIADLSTHEADLEDIFLMLTRRDPDKNNGQTAQRSGS